MFVFFPLSAWWFQKKFVTLRAERDESMKKELKTIIIILLAVLMPSALKADYVFKTLDARDGLTSSQVNCIHKDSRGFMWFGTPAGLYRYDGYRFRHFQCDSQDGTSLPDSYIESIQEALNGNLWIKTAAGYCVYDPQSESFERDMHQTFNRMGFGTVPEIVYIDRHQNMWGYIPGRGVIGYNMQQQLQYEFGYNTNANGIPQGTVCSFGECKDGTLIIYDDGRMACCDIVHQQNVVWTSTELAAQRLRKTKSLKAFADQMDNIWLYGQGTLFLYNKRMKHWNTEIGNQLDLTGIGVDHAVNAMGGDRSGNIWIGTNRHGLVRVNVTALEMDTVRMTSMMATTNTFTNLFMFLILKVLFLR